MEAGFFPEKNYLLQQQRVIAFLESLPSISQFPHQIKNTTEYLAQIIQQQPAITQSYIYLISRFLINNLENNCCLLITLDSLLDIYSILPSYVKCDISLLLKHKYPCLNFDQDLGKIRQVNRCLIEPYFYLLSRISLWHQCQIQDPSFNWENSFEFIFQIQYLHVVVKFQFDTGCQIQGIDACQPLLSIYHIFKNRPNQFYLISKQLLQKMSISIFYFLSGLKLEDIQKLKINILILRDLNSFIQYLGISLRSIVIQQIFPKIRVLGKKEQQKKQDFLSTMFDAVRGVLLINRSMDSQFEWIWIMKMSYDLLGIPPQNQNQLIKELTFTSKEITKQISMI